MSTPRKDQPAQLKRRIAQLEAHLAAEKGAAMQMWNSYRETLHEAVDLRLRLEAIERALKGEA